jgi:hypothetical protein
MKKSLLGLLLIVSAFVGVQGQLFAKTNSERSLRLEGPSAVVQLALTVVDHSSAPHYGPVVIAEEDAELLIEEKEEKEEKDQKGKTDEPQFHSGRAASLVATPRPSIKLSSKLYLRQAVLRI